jgi:uncharacterized protein YndB with AHSA1/START domain
MKLQVNIDVPEEITMVRTFDAPRRLVHQAMSQPELIKKWLGGKRATVLSAEVDHRVGGKYRYVFDRKDGGGQFAFSGVFREISEARTVHTESLEGTPGESLVTTTLVEKNGKTTMTVTMRFPTQEIRDFVVSTGMAEGAGESYDFLEALLKK